MMARCNQSSILLFICVLLPLHYSVAFTPLLSRSKVRRITSISHFCRKHIRDGIRNDPCLDMASIDSPDGNVQLSSTATAPGKIKEEDKKEQTHKSNKHGGKKPYKKKKFGKKQRVKTMFRQAKELERTGQWCQACIHFEKILEIEPRDSYTHLALARLRSRRERNIPGGIRRTQSNENVEMKVNITAMTISQTEPFSTARQAFFNGTEMCPNSIHIWQAWALYEDSIGNTLNAKTLFQKALVIDYSNPYVCHGLGLLEHRCGNFTAAAELWERPLNTKDDSKTTAALVCSLGQLMVAKKKFHEARDLYRRNVLRIGSQREAVEVYLASAWLEEKYFKQFDCAEEQLKLALQVSPNNSRAMVALARLEGRRVDSQRSKYENPNKSRNVDSKRDVKRQRDDAVKKELKDACNRLAEGHTKEKASEKSDVRDGRLFNAWAKLEVKDKNYGAARKILRQGMELFPHDHSLRQAAGKVEERVRNYIGARGLYKSSLLISPSSPTLLAYAMLEISHPIEKECNYTQVAGLFEEALLLDPRHGPVYNAYGNMELKLGNVGKARQIYQNGVYANCRDNASVYHGLAMLELSLGNVETARLVLMKGLKEFRINDSGMDSNRRKRAIFLAQSLGMLELNCRRASAAKIVFETGIEQHGNSSQLLLGSALCEAKLGNDNAARGFFERAVRVDRKHSQAWQSWGVMEMRSGNYKVAKTLFKCGIKNDSRHGALWQAYATMESRSGNKKVARTLFAAGVTKCPNHVPLYQAWACLELRSEDYDKARTLIGEALTRKKTQGSSWLLAAKIEEKSGNDGLVVLLLRRGLKHAPNSAKLYCALAEYEVNRGRIDVARKLLEEGLEVDPLHAPLYHTLAELEARVFNIDGLAQLNKRAAEVFNADAMHPPPASMQLLGNKLRKSLHSQREVPNKIASLAKLISVDLDFEESISDTDPDLLIESMHEKGDNDTLLKKFS